MKMKMDLRLFDGEGGATAGAGAAAAGSAAAAETPPSSGTAAQMGENVQNTTGGGNEGATEKSPEERKADYARFKETYKDLYREDVKDHINRRFKETQQLEDQLEAYRPLMSTLAARYGIVDATIPKIMEAIDKDDSFWEEQAMKENMTVDQLKHLRKIESQNRDLLASVDRAQQIRQREDTFARWDREAEICKQHFPQFDMMAECENEAFRRALSAGFSVEAAYKAVHFDELTGNLMAQTEKDTRKKVADSIRSGNGRPTENGVGAGSANGTKVSAWDLSKEDFHKVMERAARGEKIMI